MSVFGPVPIDPRSAQAALAAQQVNRSLERSRPANEESQRMKDARDHRVAGAESESAVRRTADEHADTESQAKQGRRDGRRDEFVHDDESEPAASHEPAKPAALPTTAPGHIDLRA